MKKNKNVATFIVFVLIVAVISGFIYGLNKTIDVSEFLDAIKNQNSNLFIPHTIYIIIILVSTLSLINIFSEMVIFSIEGLSIGFTLGVLFKNYKLNGFFFGILSSVVNKLIFLVLISYLFLISINYISKTLKNMLGIKNDYIKTLLKPLLIRFLIILVVSLINDTIIYFFGNMFLKNFINML